MALKEQRKSIDNVIDTPIVSMTDPTVASMKRRKD